MSKALDPGYVRAALISLLTANLPAKFNELDTEYADGITLNDVQRYYHAELDDYEEYPCVILRSEASAPDSQGAALYMRNQLFTIIFFEVSNEEIGTDLPPEILVKRTERSMRGIMEVLRTGYVLSISGLNARISDSGAVDYLAMEYNEEDNLFRHAVAFSINVIAKATS